MKEAADSYEFASILGDFVERARQTIWDEGGLFDKFTGDGFLAYWSPTASTRKSTLRSILRVVEHLHQEFRDRFIPLLRANSQNFPETLVGLGIGLDDGNAFPVAIADDPTIVGPAVVGAVRMVKQAGSGETWANVHLGSYLEEIEGAGSLPGIAVVRLPVVTKEYEAQTAYALKFSDAQAASPQSSRKAAS